MQFDVSDYKNDGHLTQHFSMKQFIIKTHCTTNCIKILTRHDISKLCPDHNETDSNGNAKISFRFSHDDKIPITHLNSNTALTRKQRKPTYCPHFAENKSKAKISNL